MFDFTQFTDDELSALLIDAEGSFIVASERQLTTLARHYRSVLRNLEKELTERARRTRWFAKLANQFGSDYVASALEAFDVPAPLIERYRKQYEESK